MTAEEIKVYEIISSAYKIILNSLEKQIPKKPKKVTYENFKGIANCPNCNTLITDIDSPNGCKYCLQAIDWSEEE